MAKASSKTATAASSTPSGSQANAGAAGADAAASIEVGTQGISAPTDAAGSTDASAGAPASVIPSDRGTDGTNSAHTSQEHTEEVGAGDPAGPAFAGGNPEDFPLLHAALVTLGKTVPFGIDGKVVLRVTSKQDGFRRAGMDHAKTVDHELQTFSPDQVEAILAEPMLSAELIVVPHE